MNTDEARKLIIEELANIAPEVDFDALDEDANLLEALDIDSLDFLNFITALHRRTGVNIPEKDYRKVVTLNGAIAYFAE